LVQNRIGGVIGVIGLSVVDLWLVKSKTRTLVFAAYALIMQH
jgi:hypothetical protein